MSLEELRAQVEAEEVEATEEVIELQAESVEEEAEAETEQTEGAELSDDFELELEGEPEPSQQKKQNPIEVQLEQALFKLNKERHKKKEAKSELEQVKQELAELKQQLVAKPQPATIPTEHMGEPKFPDMYDPGIDGDRDKYSKAVAKYLADMNKYNSRHSEAEQAQANRKQQLEEVTRNLAVRAAKFSTEHKVSVDRVADALNRATAAIDSAVNLDGALAWLLDSVGDGGERVAYHIGTNKAAEEQIVGMLKADPTGIKAAAYMARLADKLKPKASKQISKAPEPDQPLQGDAATMSAQRLQEAYDKETDFNKLRAIRKKARELGVTLK